MFICQCQNFFEFQIIWFVCIDKNNVSSFVNSLSINIFIISKKISFLWITFIGILKEYSINNSSLRIWLFSILNMTFIFRINIKNKLSFIILAPVYFTVCKIFPRFYIKFYKNIIFLIISCAFFNYFDWISWSSFNYNKSSPWSLIIWMLRRFKLSLIFLRNADKGFTVSFFIVANNFKFKHNIILLFKSWHIYFFRTIKIIFMQHINVNLSKFSHKLIKWHPKGSIFYTWII